MARSFNGSSDHIDLANEANFDFDLGNTFSVAFWWYPVNNLGTGQRVVAKSDGSPPTGWAVVEDAGVSNPTLIFEIRATGGDIARQGAIESSQNAWHHAVITYDGSSNVSGMVLWIDGVNDTGTTLGATTTGTILNNVPFQLACRTTTGAPELFWAGSLAHVAIWNVAISSSDASALAAGASPLRIQPASLKAYLPLWGGNPELDYAGSSNNGTLTGTSAIADPPGANKFIPAPPGIARPSILVPIAK